MPSTFANNSRALHKAIKAEDNEAVVEILEERVKVRAATEEESLLCGVLLLLPPLADYEAATRVFTDLFGATRAFEAAVWDAYRYAVLLPDGDESFNNVLQSFPRSAVAAHMLSMVALAGGDYSAAISENRRSRMLRPFPFNLSEALKRDVSLDSTSRTALWRDFCDLIVSYSAETDDPVSTVEGALQHRWDNLIVGTRITSQLWSEYQQTLTF